MFKLVDITESLSEDNIFQIKIKADAKCYNSFSFCSTYCDEKGSAFIGVLYDNCVIDANINTDYNELKKFLEFFNVKTAFCSLATAKRLQKKPLQSGIVMKHYGQAFNSDLKKISPVDYKKIYDSFKTNGFSMPEYNDFVADLSFKISHGFSRALQTENAIAFSNWETEDNAIIHGLSVDIKLKGYGSEILQNLLYLLLQDNKKNIYLYREKDKNEEFYIKNGFKNCGDFCIIKL